MLAKEWYEFSACRDEAAKADNTFEIPLSGRHLRSSFNLYKEKN